MKTPGPLAPPQSGVYRTPAHVQALRDAWAGGNAPKWLEAVLPESGGRRAALRAIASAVAAPEGTFGENWDALADVLQDLSWHEATGFVLRIADAGASLTAAERATLLEILHQTAIYWRSRDKRFVVFVDGASELPAWA